MADDEQFFLLNGNDPTREEDEEMLNCKVRYSGAALIKIDTSFLNREMEKDDIAGDKFEEDTDKFENITQRYKANGKSFHPLLSIYTDLKSTKFKRIYKWNLILFVFFFMVPFSALFMIRQFYYIPGFTKSFPLEVAFHATRAICVFSVLYVTIVELAKFLYFYRSIRDYLIKKTNIIEVILIIIAANTIGFFWLGKAEIYKALIGILGALSMLSLLCKIKFSSFPVQSMVYKRIATSFFWCLMCAVAFEFIMKLVVHKGQTFFNHSHNTNDSLVDFGDDDPFSDDDEEINPADMEESVLDLIEQQAMIVFEAIFYCVFAFTVVVKDLITFVGPEARDIVISQNASNYIEISKDFAGAFIRFRASGSSLNFQFSFWVKKTSDWLINAHPDLHRIEQIHVDAESGEVSVCGRKIYTLSISELERLCKIAERQIKRQTEIDI